MGGVVALRAYHEGTNFMTHTATSCKVLIFNFEMSSLHTLALKSGNIFM